MGGIEMDDDLSHDRTTRANSKSKQQERKIHWKRDQAPPVSETSRTFFMTHDNLSFSSPTRVLFTSLSIDNASSLITSLCYCDTTVDRKHGSYR